MVHDANQATAFTANHDLFVTGLYQFDQSSVIDWRMKGRMRTVNVALVMCLNIGVDPPDQIRPSPTATLLCWFDPKSLPPAKALATIGSRLQQQYERWQPRARYVTCLDQTADDLRKLCISLRRSSKGERILFHYNGLGVPRPTDNGEIWMFNKSYTQYVPLSIYELVSWLQSPTIYIFDCSNAGMIPAAFASYEQHRTGAESPAQNDTIILAACSAGEYIPMNPDLGVADVFTSCLTTPIQMALRWFLFTTPPFLRQIAFDQVDSIPGKPNDRKTPIGELNWIFTAVTDTIAWSSLPCALFQRLFRQDLLVASQFRNFLLACRLMQGLGCHPISQPALPDTTQHSMWSQWDLIADWACIQTRRYLQEPENFTFESSSFFTDQLTAFEIWLDLGSEMKRPLQLPVVLQVLLSQTHRLRALQLLARFVDMGPWAVNQALSVGIFPYILKLLQSPTHELRNVLVFIWAKIIALDQSCQRELIKDQYHLYFTSAASSQSASPLQKSFALFVLASIAENYRPGQLAIASANGFALLLNILSPSKASSPLMRHMALMCLGNLWKLNGNGRQLGLVYNDGYGMAVDAVVEIALTDPHPLTRASALYALAMFLLRLDSASSLPNDHRMSVNIELVKKVCKLQNDACALVRQQFLHCIAALVQDNQDAFTFCQKGDDISGHHQIDRGFIEESITHLCKDPNPVVSQTAQRLASFVLARSDQICESSSLSEDDPNLLQSTLFQFSSDLIRRPSQQRSRAFADHDEMSYLSSDLSEHNRIARQRRFDRIDAEALKIGTAGDFSHCMALVTSPFNVTTSMKLHPYDPVLIASDSNRICLVNYSSMNVGPTCNNESEITSLDLINPRRNSLILTASVDGAIRIWSDIGSDEFSQRSAFLAYQSMSSEQRVHVFTDWQQRHLKLITASNCGPIKIWDLEYELCIRERGIDSTGIRSLCSDGDHVLFTAHDNRQIRFSDIRLGQSGSTVLYEDDDDIIAVCSQRHSASPLLVSCSDRGYIHTCDLRMPSRRLSSFQGIPTGSKPDRWRTFAISDCGNLYAGASAKQSVNIGTLTGSSLNTWRHYDGFIGQRIGTVNCLKFHERFPILAVGTNDNHIALFCNHSHNGRWFSF